MIRLKDAEGRLRPLTANEFERTFGVKYAQGLIPPGVIPTEFLRACEQHAERGLESIVRRISDHEIAPLYIAKVSDTVGYGIFAAEDIAEGRLIGEYAGVLTADWQPTKEGGAFNPYLLKYPFDTAYAIDAQRWGNELRFTNHSSKGPNVRRIYVLLAGLLHVAFIASSPIPKDAQVLLDYGAGYWSAEEPAELGADE